MLLHFAAVKSRRFRRRKMRSAAKARRKGRLRPLMGGATFILLYCLDQVVTYFQSGITRRTLQNEPTGSLVPEIWKL